MGLDLQAAPSPPTSHPHCRMTVPISVTNPELLRHSTELFMDSGFSPKSQRIGAMVAFQRFEDFVRYPAGLGIPRTPQPQGLSVLPLNPNLFTAQAGGGGLDTWLRDLIIIE